MYQSVIEVDYLIRRRGRRRYGIRRLARNRNQVDDCDR